MIAPSGAQFFTGEAFPAWRGNLFVGSLKDQMLVRIILENDRVTGEEHLLKDRGRPDTLQQHSARFMRPPAGVCASGPGGRGTPRPSARK